MPWTVAATNTDIVAIHAALLPTVEHGQLLIFGDWKSPASGTTHSRIYTIEPESVVSPENLPSQNLFCAGQAFLADGRLLIAGGTAAWPEVAGDQPLPPGKPHGHHYNGERACYMYLPRQKKFDKAADLSFQPESTVGGGRWYPVLVTLHTGQVWATAGHPDITDDFEDRHNNNTPEYYSPSTDSWTLTTAARTAPGGENTDSYPRFHLLPSGHLFSDTAGFGDGKRIFDPFAGSWTPETFTTPGNWEGSSYDRGSAATSVLLPLLPPDYKPRVLLSNGASTFLCDVEAGAFAETSSRQGSAVGKVRNHACAVILPTGQVLVTGGVTYHPHPDLEETNFARGVYETEIYDPGDFGNPQGWTTLPAAEQSSVLRGYHSTALLLPDGRVWTGGSTETHSEEKGSSNITQAGAAEHRAELYSPAYVGQSKRPSITQCPASIGYGMQFTVTTPQAASISRVALTRCGSITHAYDSDQRYVGLEFQKGNGVLTVLSPPDAKIAPPAYYLLWIIDSQNRVCQLAKFIRVCDQKCDIHLDISTFSKHEAQAAGTPALFTEAVYVVYDGFLPGEVEQPSITLRRPDNTPPPNMSLDLIRTSYEAGSGEIDTAQRIVYVYDVVFDDNESFDEIPASEAFQTVSLRADMKHYSCSVPLTLSKNPNPFMRDGDPPWLSIDLRVFRTREHATEDWSAGTQHGGGGNAPFEYLSALLTKYNDLSGDDDHPFKKIDPTQEGSHLAVYTIGDDNKRVYNYAVARVGFRALEGVNAEDVRVFFRLCTTGWTGLDYDTTRSYRRHGDGPTATPLLGLVGGEINTVPCFAAPRVMNASMTTQSDPLNKRTLFGGGNTEVQAYFGCWIDINDSVPRYPLEPPNDGPFQELWPGYLQSVQGLLRGLHQCLVAEVHYSLDPIPPNSTPGTSDNLAQRNILLDESDNPGGPGTHLVHHTFELKPTAFSAGAPLPTMALVQRHAVPAHEHPHGHVHGDVPRVAAEQRAVEAAAAAARRTAPGAAAGSGARISGPDYLMIHWGNLPRSTHASFYFPSFETDVLLRYESERHGPGNLSRGEDHTVNVKVTDVGFVTIPASPRGIPGLVTLQLPPGVATGQRFRIVMQHVQRRTHKIIGTFELYVRVTSSGVIVPELRRNFSVLKHIGQAIPEANRWYPIWQRYLDQMATRLRAFGVNPDEIRPSSSGTGTDEEGEQQEPPDHGHPDHGHPHDGHPDDHGHPDHGHPEDPCCDAAGEDDDRRQFSGVIDSLEYDSHGHWIGFRLQCGHATRRFPACDRALEEVIRRCCVSRSTVTVTAVGEGHCRVLTVRVHCC